jgi:hypothetical protein
MLRHLTFRLGAGTSKVPTPLPAGFTRDESHKVMRESRRHAASLTMLLVGLQVLLAVISRRADWATWRLPWWGWLLPIVVEIPLFLALTWALPHRPLEQRGHRRALTASLAAAVAIANVGLLASVVASLTQTRTTGRELLLEGMAVWITNVICFAIVYWELDSGGPIVRCSDDAGKEKRKHFRFPQHDITDMEFLPGVADYVYLSFTNSMAFSPTDAMPLHPHAKLLMAAEAAISAATVLVVTARAINIFH